MVHIHIEGGDAKDVLAQLICLTQGLAPVSISIPAKDVPANTGAQQEETPPPARAKRAPKEKPEVVNDPPADELKKDEPVETSTDVKVLLPRLVHKVGRDKAIAMLKEHGAQKVGDLVGESLTKFVAAATAAINA